MIENWGRSIRFRQQNLCLTPQSGRITMTSFPVGNEISLFQKPCIADKKLLWITFRKSWSLFQNSSEAPSGEVITMTSFPACNKTSLSQKPCIPDKMLLWNAIRESCLLFQNPSWKIAWSAPGGEKVRASFPGGGLTMTSCLVGKKHRYLGKHTSHIK